MDELAYALRMDPLALRLANYAERDEQKDKPFASKDYGSAIARRPRSLAGRTAIISRAACVTAVSLSAGAWPHRLIRQTGVPVRPRSGSMAMEQCWCKAACRTLVPAPTPSWRSAQRTARR